MHDSKHYILTSTRLICGATRFFKRRDFGHHVLCQKPHTWAEESPGNTHYFEKVVCPDLNWHDIANSEFLGLNYERYLGCRA